MLIPGNLCLAEDISPKQNNDPTALNEVLEADFLAPPTHSGIWKNTAQLSFLDKRLGKVSETIDLPLGESYEYKNLKIILEKCWQNTEEGGENDNRALISTHNLNPGGGTDEIWLSSKFPGLSNLEHPRLEIILVKCKN